MELIELFLSAIPWIIGIVVALLLCFVLFISLLFYLPWMGFTQFMNIDIKDVEETILKNQLKRLQKATGMILPPYLARFQEPVTDLNGSFYGAIYIEFKELLTEEYLEELEKRIKNANPWFLWTDKKLSTLMILFLEKDKHYIWLRYNRGYWEKQHGGFNIRDRRNAVPLDMEDLKKNSFGIPVS